MSNESMANQITDVPSAIAELLAVNKQLEQELQKTREQLSKAEQRIFHLGECSSLWEYQGICDCGYEQCFKDKQGE